MKKNKLAAIIIFIVGFVFLLSGFVFNYLEEEGSIGSGGSSTADKEMVCNINEVDGENKIHYEYKFAHKDDKLKKYSKIFTYHYTKETEETALRYKGEGMDTTVSLAKNVPGIDISYTDVDFVITNNYVYDLEKIDQTKYQDYSEIFPIYNLDESVDSITETLKSWGYTCK